MLNTAYCVPLSLVRYGSVVYGHVGVRVGGYPELCSSSVACPGTQLSPSLLSSPLPSSMHHLSTHLAATTLFTVHHQAATTLPSL